MSAAPPPIVRVEALSHEYPVRGGTRRALREVSFRVDKGERYALLGPNGGGKSTTFNILSTLIPPQSGKAALFGRDLARDADLIRAKLGVVFQHPAVDGALTCEENLRHHGWLYGLSGADLSKRTAAALDGFGLGKRGRDLARELSGGLRRRLELAKALLHDPELLLLDEPTTGLDPAARRDLWARLEALRAERRLTILFTTHLMEEAEASDYVAILDGGRVVADGTPKALTGAIGGGVLRLRADDAAALAERVRERFGGSPRALDGVALIESDEAHTLLPKIVEAFPGEIREASFSKPGLEDVFIHATGRRFRAEEAA